MKYFFTLTIMSVLFLSACNDEKHQSYLSDQQLMLLNTPSMDNTVTFNENGQLITLQVEKLFTELYQQEYLKGGMFSPSRKYYGEIGKRSYYLPNGNYKLIIKAYSDNLYRSVPDDNSQLINLYSDETVFQSSFVIDFTNRLPSKEIGGVTYTNVLLGVDSYRNDTLFWKKDIGILGWKRSDENFTAYRVF